MVTLFEHLDPVKPKAYINWNYDHILISPPLKYLS